MGAYSVTGISGPGSSEGKNRGPGNGRNEYVSLISPHVVAAGSVTLASGVFTLTLPTPLTGGYAKYIVMLTDVGTGNNGVSVSALTNDGNGNFASFVINGTSTDVVNYAIVSVGHGA